MVQRRWECRKALVRSDLRYVQRVVANDMPLSLLGGLESAWALGPSCRVFYVLAFLVRWPFPARCG